MIIQLFREFNSICLIAPVSSPTRDRFLTKLAHTQ
jgi:hypothetical protein